MNRNKKESSFLADIAVKALEEKLGKDITLIDFDKVKDSLFDFYVICTANNPSHADTLASQVQKKIKEIMNISPFKTEGLQNCSWVLLDYFDVIVHIFLPDTREFYNIEKMFKDVEQIHFQNPGR